MSDRTDIHYCSDRCKRAEPNAATTATARGRYARTVRSARVAAWFAGKWCQLQPVPNYSFKPTPLARLNSGVRPQSPSPGESITHANID